MKLSTAHNLQKGFTLIELLVVIGILGILAAALVATIDPFEQLRKARDARTQNISVELQGALIRYYTTHERAPWEDPDGIGPITAACDMGGNDIAPGVTVQDLITGGCLDVLIQEGELKQAFTTADGLGDIYISEPYCTSSGCTQNGAGSAIDGSPAICYIPESRSGLADDNNRYDQDGSIGTCTQAGSGADLCHWCAL